MFYYFENKYSLLVGWFLNKNRFSMLWRIGGSSYELRKYIWGWEWIYFYYVKLVG